VKKENLNSLVLLKLLGSFIWTSGLFYQVVMLHRYVSIRILKSPIRSLKLLIWHVKHRDSLNLS